MTLVLLTMMGCNPFEGPPTIAARIANEIGGDASRAEKVVKDHHLSAKQLDDMMYVIALDESMTKSYRSQLK